MTFMEDGSIFDVNLPQQYQAEGYQEGLLAGERKAFDEGFYLGVEEGEKLGSQLGIVAGALYSLLSGSVPLSEAVVRKIKKILAEVPQFSLTNEVDEGKEQRLIRIHAAYRELALFLSKDAGDLPPLDDFHLGAGAKSSFDF